MHSTWLERRSGTWSRALLSRLVPERALGAAAALTVVAAWLFVAGSPDERRRIAPWVFATLVAAVAVLLGGDRLLGDRVTPEKALAQSLSFGGKIVATEPSINGRVDVSFLKDWHLIWGATNASRRAGLPTQLQLFIDGDALTSITDESGRRRRPSSWRRCRRA